MERNGKYSFDGAKLQHPQDYTTRTTITLISCISFSRFVTISPKEKQVVRKIGMERNGKYSFDGAKLQHPQDYTTRTAITLISCISFSRFVTISPKEKRVLDNIGTEKNSKSSFDRRHFF
ncbi:hypothetical protein AVEN_16689-1 [Araneus ventricosus]|uniref:Uncharacterized protein n=1 Tax=Araneus ventricosus TaxID=182803 RepID=A0A4Y2NEP5_ARAVE|nr:hypothetical protein AVEN_16689-1 [Araneus ventricosus]